MSTHLKTHGVDTFQSHFLGLRGVICRKWAKKYDITGICNVLESFVDLKSIFLEILPFLYQMWDFIVYSISCRDEMF